MQVRMVTFAHTVKNMYESNHATTRLSRRGGGRERGRGWKETRKGDEDRRGGGGEGVVGRIKIVQMRKGEKQRRLVAGR